MRRRAGWPPHWASARGRSCPPPRTPTRSCASTAAPPIYLSADATSLNTLTGRLAGDRIDLRDPTIDGGIDPGPCDPGAITPDANAWIIQVFCPRPRTARLRIDLGEREDSASLDVPVPVDMSGGPGSDTLRHGGARPT